MLRRRPGRQAASTRYREPSAQRPCDGRARPVAECGARRWRSCAVIASEGRRPADQALVVRVNADHVAPAPRGRARKMRNGSSSAPLWPSATTCRSAATSRRRRRATEAQSRSELLEVPVTCPAVRKPRRAATSVVSPTPSQRVLRRRPPAAMRGADASRRHQKRYSATERA
jgi:hypothetical protein